MINVTLKTLPALKRAATDRRRRGGAPPPRVVNVTSAAGLCAAPGFAAYNVSKFAAEAFSSCLRMELGGPVGAWGIPVVTVNPTFHETPLVAGAEHGIRRRWEQLSASARAEEYGEAHAAAVFACAANMCRSLEWEPRHVISALSHAVTDPWPRSQYLVGMDCKTAIPIGRCLPPAMYDAIDAIAHGWWRVPRPRAYLDHTPSPAPKAD